MIYKFRAFCNSLNCICAMYMYMLFCIICCICAILFISTRIYYGVCNRRMGSVLRTCIKLPTSCLFFSMQLYQQFKISTLLFAIILP